MNEFEAILAHRNGEREMIRKPKTCDNCGQKKPDIDLFDDLGNEWVYWCGECAGKENLLRHQQDHPDAKLVLFDGKKCGALPDSWFTDRTYGSLLPDGRILVGIGSGLREYQPDSYEIV